MSVTACPPLILQFFANGQPLVGGSVLTQVGGVNTPTFQDAAGSTPLPNPIPLNSRGEISNASGLSCQLFITYGVTYVFTVKDAAGNIVETANSVSGQNVNVIAGGLTLTGGLSMSGGLTTDTLSVTGATTLASYSASAQPSFLAYRGSNQSLATAATLLFDTKAYDIGTAYSTSTGIYTVPAGQGGRYLISTTLVLQNSSAGTDTLWASISGGSISPTAVLESITASSTRSLSLSYQDQLAAGATISVGTRAISNLWTAVFQPNGGANRGCTFSMTKLN